MDEMHATQLIGMMHDKIYSIMDVIEDIRGQDAILEALKEAYPEVSRAFLLKVFEFERDIQQISQEKEPVGVIVHGEQWISNIHEISERGLLIEPHVSAQGRGAGPRLVSIAQVKRWIYE